ncbi:MAG: DUF2254 domain-containing protein [Planctomycetia bacterium]|nr:DUF2254 domain-containing protein [Planctomycetia bacterium]
MTWLQRHQVRHYITNSLWIGPVLAMAAALAVIHLLHGVDTALGWRSGIDPDTVRGVLGAMAASTFTFVVFVSSALLVAVQLASSLLTPRVIALMFQDSVTRTSLTVFVFTFTFSLGALVRVGDSVPLLTAYTAAYSSLANLGVFLYLIDHVGKTLRPSGALWMVAAHGREVIAHVYPRRFADAPSAVSTPQAIPEGAAPRVVASPKDGVVLAFDIPGLVSLARRAECIIEFVPQVGDFVAAGDPLFRVFPAGAALSAESLQQSVAVGQERTLEQDPAFAFRIIVDIASKGLSPAINDPTTAVLALDQIHHLLREVGQRRLDDDRVRDRDGRLRLIYRTPGWEDFVHLAVTEIRQFGGTSIQIARRLRAMLENLMQTVPGDRAVLLGRELQLLHRSAERFFTEPEDRALAEISDSQGVGGKASGGATTAPGQELR